MRRTGAPPARSSAADALLRRGFSGWSGGGLNGIVGIVGIGHLGLHGRVEHGNALLEQPLLLRQQLLQPVAVPALEAAEPVDLGPQLLRLHHQGPQLPLATGLQIGLDPAALDPRRPDDLLGLPVRPSPDPLGLGHRLGQHLLGHLLRPRPPPPTPPPPPRPGPGPPRPRPPARASICPAIPPPRASARSPRAAVPVPGPAGGSTGPAA